MSKNIWASGIKNEANSFGIAMQLSTHPIQLVLTP